MSLKVQTLSAGLVLTLAVLLGSAAYAANSATINVTVTIQNLSVSASGPIAFGVVVASSTTVSTDSSHVVNDGNVAETYDIKLTDPAGWTAVSTAPGAEEYRLSAQFNSDAPTALSFDGNHDLSTSDQTSSASIFAGDQTGLAVPSTEARYLWFKFEAPTSTIVTAEQTVVVTVTASAA